MNIQDCVTIAEACQMIGTYDRLFSNLAKLHGVKVVRRGRYRFVLRADVEKLRPFADEWKKRPRLSRVATA